MVVVSDRVEWLELPCPECHAAPGARCRWQRLSKKAVPTALHVARGWRARCCPTCRAESGEPCATPSGREASRPHAARLRPGRHELVALTAVWEELERRGASIALVPFSGRGGEGGRIGRIVLRRLQGDALVQVERWCDRDELAFALEAPVWDRYGSFAGHPRIGGEVTWTLADRSIVIAGVRGRERFEEVIA